MDYLGLACLGGFVGAVVTIGLKFIGNTSDYKQILLTILGAALSGTVLLFINRFRNTRALGAYCVGLLVAYMWAYTAAGVEAFESDDPNTHLIGMLHLGGVGLVTIVAAVLFLPPAFREVWGNKGGHTP